MARAALKWRMDDLSNESKVSKTTIYSFENGKDTYTSTIAKLEAAILATGKIRFEGKCVCLID